jgi:hypothetical protein
MHQPKAASGGGMALALRPSFAHLDTVKIINMALG